MLCAVPQCVCEWRDREALFVRLEGEVRRDLAAGRLPPVQPFHIMAYPFPADLAKVNRLLCRMQPRQCSGSLQAQAMRQLCTSCTRHRIGVVRIGCLLYTTAWWLPALQRFGVAPSCDCCSHCVFHT